MVFVKSRPNWLDYPDVTTLIRAQDLNNWETGIFSAHQLLGIGAIATKTAAYTLTGSDGLILADATSAAFTLTLPAAASNAGKIFFIKRTNGGANAVTVSRAGADTIDGDTSIVLKNQHQGLIIESDGSATWRVVQGERRNIYVNGASIGRRAIINFIAGSGVTIAGVDDSTNEKVDITVTSTGGGATPTQGIPRFYPETYGAVGDGVTLDHAAIQAAIDAANTRTPRGGVVELGSNYRIGAAIAMKSNVHLMGAGVPHRTTENSLPGSDTIVGMLNVSTSYTGDMVTGTNQCDFAISGVRFWRKDAPDGNYSALHLNLCERVYITDCFFRGSDVAAAANRKDLYMHNGTEQIWVTRCRFQGGEISTSFANVLRVTDCEFTGSNYGINFVDGNNLFVVGTHIYEPQISCIRTDNSNVVNLVNSYFEQAKQHTLDFIATHYVSVGNCNVVNGYIAKLTGNTYDQIHIDNASYDDARQINICGNTILDNQATKNTRWGVNVLKSDATKLTNNIAIVGNVFEGLGGAGTSGMVNIGAGVTAYRVTANPGVTDATG